MLCSGQFISQVKLSLGLGKLLKWVDDNKPVWWPSNLGFRSPHGKVKIPVCEMVMILQSFHEHQVMKIVVRMFLT